MISISKKNTENEALMLGGRPELNGMRVLRFVLFFLIYTLLLMPQYFGLDIGYDITCSRLADMFIVVYFIMNPASFKLFTRSLYKCYLWIPLAFFLFVAGYTMVYRIEINAFMLPFLEIFTFFVLIFGIRFVIGYKVAIKCIINCAYVLAGLGIVEYIYGDSFFLKFLKTVPTAVEAVYRSGKYRIMGPCDHPLGYGLLLIFLLAACCIDIDNDKIYLFQRPILLGMLFLNIVLTGSRSTLAIALLEMAIIIVFTEQVQRRKTLFFLLVVVFALGTFLLLFRSTNIAQYILMQFASIIDEIFDTELAVKYGADTEWLEDSSNYRKYLPRILTLEWLNPLVGRGQKGFGGAEIDGVFIHSIDNFFVVQYIKFAYPGLISYLSFMIMALVTSIKATVKHKSGVIKAITVALICYYVNLWFLDDLQTIRFSYLFIAILIAYIDTKKAERALKINLEAGDKLCNDSVVVTQ